MYNINANPEPDNFVGLQMRVDLHFFPNNDTSDKDPNRDLATFWRFARSFTSTKGMRLTVNHLEDIAVLSEGRRVELLPAFHRLERLEVRGVHRAPNRESEAVAIANLLHCCPVLRDLRINLTGEHDDTSKDLDRKFRSDRHKSVPEGDVDDGASYDDAFDMPVLSRLIAEWKEEHTKDSLGV